MSGKPPRADICWPMQRAKSGTGCAARLSSGDEFSFYQRADSALYYAKNQGRNRIFANVNDAAPRRLHE